MTRSSTTKLSGVSVDSTGYFLRNQLEMKSLVYSCTRSVSEDGSIEFVESISLDLKVEKSGTIGSHWRCHECRKLYPRTTEYTFHYTPDSSTYLCPECAAASGDKKAMLYSQCFRGMVPFIVVDHKTVYQFDVFQSGVATYKRTCDPLVVVNWSAA